PLPHEWMLVSIIGFFISVFQIYVWDKTWGITLIIFFTITFIASVVSMSGSGTSEEEMIELAVHDKRVRAAKHRKKK
ncbi:hypothetical protein GOV07_00635, partial [Candidatus Woesearchaeota archaeon]|nr:hypothetical protein [Candidatus Woesearchaeota archaeon]